MALVDPLPYAEFVVRHLLRELPEFVGARRGIAETEVPFSGDDWYWADDNAKALELLALPEVWRQYPGDVEDVIRFVLALCDGPFIFRRLAAPRLQVNKTEEGNATLVHGLMDVSSNLRKGIVNLGIRFHDGRTARNVSLTGNYVRFIHKGRSYVVDVEEGISFSAVEPTANGYDYIWRADLDFVSGFRPFGKRWRLGTITYTVSILTCSTFFDCRAALDLDPSIEVSDVTLTIGQDDLSHNDNGVRYERIHIATPDKKPLSYSSTAEGQGTQSAPGACYWSVAQTSQIKGFALGLHSLPGETARFAALNVVRKKDGYLHWVASEYLFPGKHRGSQLRASERKTLTAGGFYDLSQDYSSMLARHAQGAGASKSPLDLSISYDYGAEIASFARCFRVLSGADAPAATAGLMDELRVAADRLLDVYDTHFVAPFRHDASAIFSRSLAFVAFACADMLIATKEPRYGTRLRELCELLLTFERQNAAVNGSQQSGFAMGREPGSLPYVDCHASCLLALVRATALLGESTWLASIDRGLSAYRLDTVAIEFDHVHHVQDLVGIDYLGADNVRQTLNSFWNFTSGLSLRLFNALRVADHAGLRDVWSRHAQRIEAMELLMRNRIERSLRPRGSAIEILTSVLSGETNSETQPWVALGLTGRVEA